MSYYTDKCNIVVLILSKNNEVVTFVNSSDQQSEQKINLRG